MFDQLQKLEDRSIELEQLLSSPEILSDREMSNKLAKELSGIRGPVSLFREYKKILKESSDLQAVLKDKHDQEFIDLAKSELQELEAKKEEIEARIKVALTEEDKDADRDVILEIRQGTGGDEAGLFAADLTVCILSMPRIKAGPQNLCLRVIMNPAALRKYLSRSKVKMFIEGLGSRAEYIVCSVFPQPKRRGGYILPLPRSRF